jgi:leader peptidase (prepilin peptidase)/N-methyltransferase
MQWWAVLLAVAAAGVLTAVTPWILRRLPAPVDDPGSDPYRPLVTRGFLAAVFGASLAANALGFALLPLPTALAWVSLSTCGVLLGCIDQATTYLPLRLTQVAWALAAAGVLPLGLLQGWLALAQVALGAALARGLIWAFWRWGGGFAFGDVRLAALVGATAATVSFPFVSWALLLGSLVGVVLGVVSRMRTGQREYPYGPALVIGPYLALLPWTLTSS